MLAHSEHGPLKSMPFGRPASNNIGTLGTRHNKHWPGNSDPKWRCRVSTEGGVTRTGMFNCVKCEMILFVDRNFLADYHTKT